MTTDQMKRLVTAGEMTETTEVASWLQASTLLNHLSRTLTAGIASKTTSKYTAERSKRTPSS